jgi:IS5 family transposase
MRQYRKNQPSFPLHQTEHRHGKELEEISRILDENPTLAEVVLQESETDPGRGAPGMTGEQILRCAIVKQMEGLSYDRLAFALEDSLSLRDFCGFSFQKAPKRSTLAENISRIGWKGWKQITDALTRWATGEGLEKGRKVRIDATSVESHVLKPTDNQLLYDCVQVLTLLLRNLRTIVEFGMTDHRRRARKRNTQIRNARRQSLRVSPYRDLLQVAVMTRSYVDRACQAADISDPVVCKLVRRLSHFAELTDRVIDQTRRRVLQGQTVPASEKLVSIFEEHTDILRKGSRDPVYGHKLFLTCGKTSLITDCLLERGNPADATRLRPMLERQNSLYERYPRQAAADGGFSSAENLNWARNEAGIKDMSFSKKCRLKVSHMVKSSWVYRRLKNFRAGVEGCISFFKRGFGGGHCNWNGWEGFQQYVHLSVLSYNLLVLARLRLA